MSRSSFKPYILDGRDAETHDGKPDMPCIFCGRSIRHFNEGGGGWAVGAVVAGKPLGFLYCHLPACEAAKQHDHEIWRCGCISDYAENVGDQCSNCRRVRADALPWDLDVETAGLRLIVENTRAVVLQEVYKLLPKEQIQTWGSDLYSSMTGFLSPDGSFRRNSWAEADHNPSHIRDLPLESLLTLQRILQHPRYGL